MLGSIQDKKLFLILLGLSTTLGYFIVFLFAYLKYKGDDKKSFIKKKGRDLSMIILISIPGSFFGALFLWGGIFIVLESIFKVSFSLNQRFFLLEICYVIFLLGSLAYAFKQIVMEAGPGFWARRSDALRRWERLDDRDAQTIGIFQGGIWMKKMTTTKKATPMA